MINKDFCERVSKYIDNHKSKDLYINIKIGTGEDIDIKKDIYMEKIDFNLDLTEAFNDASIQGYKISLFFKEITFCKQVTFRDIKLETLSFKDVIFKKNVGIKENRINKLILRPYEINAHIVINNGGYATDGYIKKPYNAYINNLIFEDPHICKAKIYFIGISGETECNFSNRNLENIIFQNCNFQKTKFLNSFLKEAKFFNCEFPIVDNEIATLILIPRYILIVSITAISGALFTYVNNQLDYLFILIVATLVAFTITVFYEFSSRAEIKIGNFIKNKMNTSNMIGKHIGIYDELHFKNNFEKYEFSKKEFYEEHFNTFKNISNIYKDLKINFSNNGDLQKSGDFYYASSLLMLPIGTFIDKLLLMLSYIFNGFGERPLKSFAMLTILLFSISLIYKPNKHYISTPSTPDFLLQVDDNDTSDTPFTIYDFKKFQKVYEPVKSSYNKNNSYEYNTKFSFDNKDRYIPSLKDNDISVRVYYALSHITAPFTMKNKEWFKPNNQNTYMSSMLFGIFIWLYFIGMMKAFFNRIKR